MTTYVATPKGYAAVTHNRKTNKELLIGVFNKLSKGEKLDGVIKNINGVQTLNENLKVEEDYIRFVPFQ